MNALSSGFKPFTRVMSAPASLPWTQMKAVTLEAAHTSPMPVDQVEIILKRLEPWTYGKSGRFIAIYLRRTDIVGGLSFDVDIDGKILHIDLPNRAQREAETAQRAWVMGLSLIIITGLLAMGALSLKRRMQEQARFDEVEQKLERALHLSKGYVAAKSDAASLQTIIDQDGGAKAQSFSEALKDLKYIANNRDPEAQIEAYYWNRGHWGLEVKGTSAPLKDGETQMKKAPKPVRSGVWLWVAQTKTEVSQ